MQNIQHLTQLVQANKSTDNFNHNLVVDWAMALLESGKESANLYMLASFSPPVDAFEIRPYLLAVLEDLGLKELEGDEAALANIRYYITEIVLEHSIRSNLTRLYELSNKYEPDFGLGVFYNLYFEWEDLEAGEYNFYYGGATLKNIESIVKKEALAWLEEH